MYNYLFYRGFDLLSLTGNYDLAWGASHLLALILSMALTVTLNFLFAFQTQLALSLTGLVLFILIHILNYNLYIKQDKYKDVIEGYKSESMLEKKIGRIVSMLVILLVVYSTFQ